MAYGMLQYRNKLGPNYTLKEWFYLAFAFIGATLAAVGGVRISHQFVDDIPADYSLSLFLGLGVFFGVLALMISGIEHIRKQRRAHELEELLWSRKIDQQEENKQA